VDPRRDGRSHDDVLGPPAARVRAKLAIGSPPADAHAGVLLRFFAGVLRWLVPAGLAGKQRPSPFFDASGNLVAQPSVLTPAERERLRA
jgi:hypothetical protein